jgi:uncharacterized protein (TIGR03083 family)
MKPLLTAHLFPDVQRGLMEALRGLAPEDWARPTACRLWSVKDVAAHLLDTNLRRLSAQRDGFRMKSSEPIATFQQLTAFIDQLNANWVAAFRPIGPRILVELIGHYGAELSAFMASLDPFAPAPISVAWAGESVSLNWMDTGREYTERWLHQQHIREATGQPLLDEPRLMAPVLDIFMRALPRTYEAVEAPQGTLIRVRIESPAGGVWELRRNATRWEWAEPSEEMGAVEIVLSPNDAWKLFTKGLAPEAAAKRVQFRGDANLGCPFLRQISIMG